MRKLTARDDVASERVAKLSVEQTLNITSSGHLAFFLVVLN